MSCVDPDVDDALVDHPHALAVLAAAIPDLLKTIDDPPYFSGADNLDKIRARHIYWTAGDSCPGGECINLLRVLARRGYARQVHDAGALPILREMFRFCVTHPKFNNTSDTRSTAATYTWNAKDVRLLLADIREELPVTTVAMTELSVLAPHYNVDHDAAPAPAFASAASQTNP